jgi:Family of unknown function (DUF5989)
MRLTMTLVHHIWTARDVWLGPLIAALLIVGAMFVIAGGPVDAPLIYRSAK